VLVNESELTTKSYPRVLVVSHNVLSPSTNMGKTMLDFFAGWNQNQIAQLYFHNEVPTADVCKSYYRMTDFDMLESIFKFTSPGAMFDQSKIDSKQMGMREDTEVQASFYQIGARRKPYVYFFRNRLWRIKRWKTKKLMSWVAECNPEVVFYAAGDYVFSMKIALDISQERSIPLVVYFGDDFYFLENTVKLSLFEQSNKKDFRKQFEKLFAHLSTFTAATDKLAEKYGGYFDKAGYAILSSTEIQQKIEKRNEVVKISYIGNVNLNRWRSLIDIGRCLKEQGLVLDVYSIEKDPEILSELTLENGVSFQGSLPPEKVKDMIRKSTIVIHVEALDERSKQSTKYSLSTKIGDSLGSGVCLFAYGPADVASIAYLLENEVAYVCTKKKKLQEQLVKILNDADLRQHYLNNALELAAVRHDLKINADLFYEMICSVT